MRLSDRPTIALMVLLGWSVLAGQTARAGSPDQAAVEGIWSGGDSLIMVTVRGESLSMTVLAIRDAVYGPDEGIGEPGTPRRDDKNPDPMQQNRLLAGLELLADYRWTGRRWEGKVYDPASGNTYSSRMQLDGNRLMMRGYIGMPMLGRTRYFDRVESCEAPVAEMVAASRAELALCD
jgi:uncharacterized protein (DUF2147 family)